MNKGKASTTSLAVAGLGAVVSLLGYRMQPKNNKLGTGMLGFGLAHVALGLLDRMRPSVKVNS